ncbi:MAG: carboxypeptidase-like regulatory domain-containing protein [Pseudomonadota bacterium]|nr:carboxypeptidase-like regulatory domain-containing protein [Pseudomonadota bacterium]
MELNGTGLDYFNCDAAVPVPSDSVQNLTVQTGEVITGIVTASDGTTPFFNVCVTAYTDTCHNGHAGNNNTNANGHYRIVVPAAGDYYLYAQPQCNETLSVLEEWWNGADGTIDCNNAAPVTVIAGEECANKDFTLAQAYTISGTVTDGTNPVANIDVNAHEGNCGTPGMTFGGSTDSEGHYRFTRAIQSSSAKNALVRHSTTILQGFQK